MWRRLRRMVLIGKAGRHALPRRTTKESYNHSLIIRTIPPQTVSPPVQRPLFPRVRVRHLLRLLFCLRRKIYLIVWCRYHIHILKLRYRVLRDKHLALLLLRPRKNNRNRRNRWPRWAFYRLWTGIRRVVLRMGRVRPEQDSATLSICSEEKT